MELVAKPFLFIRHGETFHNRARVIAGSRDVLLTPKGQQQAIAARAALHHWQGEIVAASSLRRAVQTAELALPAQRIATFDGLRERNWGPLELGPVLAEMPYLDPPAGAEPWVPFVERVGTTLNHLLERYHHPVVVAHSGVFRAIRQLVHGSHRGESAPNALPIAILPPDASHAEWRFGTQI
ncbi:histidine phosphatase family protein [Carnimonas nigrificans]|uniref:histidine phosphatase family protein n=1 Tax=Carnimonas nigrificans TaxID=64323 RepID=UPI00047036AD|nr:histidine phosphatase family protein [Carnimonas nigrificans]